MLAARVSVINSVLLVVLWGLKTFLPLSDTNLRNCSGQTLYSLTSSDRRKAADGVIHQGRTEGVRVCALELADGAGTTLSPACSRLVHMCVSCGGLGSERHVRA